ncbi:hypothetical protein PE067_17905 [Paracoccus sp. DMF-8]|uniref:hypothetical protein n=1 Tax=Paracoccus sp. DMF-8 TaxID=3019445 RepID=UPI0023E39493|nr:hypothetical protein [Paracoccus sp. DMF-8]MDF3607851.1 hypothetical protein [Paracoccus sp. DMF-8]
MTRSLFLFLAALLMAGLPLRLAASPQAEVCEWAVQQVARESGVPADILAALTLTETGRRIDGVVRPWAWSANAEGAGSWFDDPESAIAFAQSRVDQGRPNIDIGCFQLNYRWHGENFSSVRQMFDPLENARYAARFVSELYTEFGDWRVAAGAFHSRTPQYANRYLARFDTLRALHNDRGFMGMTGSPETYNTFAAVDSQPGRRRMMRERVTILGAPLGSGVDGAHGSLAVMGGARASPIHGTRGPMIVVSAAQPTGGGTAAPGSLWRGGP